MRWYWTTSVSTFSRCFQMLVIGSVALMIIGLTAFVPFVFFGTACMFLQNGGLGC